MAANRRREEISLGKAGGSQKLRETSSCHLLVNGAETEQAKEPQAQPPEADLIPKGVPQTYLPRVKCWIL